MNNITKASGQVELFVPEKIERSLRKIGAPDGLIHDIISGVKAAPHIATTRDVYRYVSNRLKMADSILASRYHLKNALYELGPGGFLFEKFTAELFKAQQFETATGQIVAGKCVDHEIDVIAYNLDSHFMVECKFHNSHGLKTDVKVALYIQARYQDIQETVFTLTTHTGSFNKAWLATNTKFTTDAIRYAQCNNMGLIGWAYPQNTSIETMVDYYGLYPITSLVSLTYYQKKLLLEAGILLCKDLATRTHLPIALTPQQLSAVQKECAALSEPANRSYPSLDAPAAR